MSKLFRKSAIEKLSSPDQLDKALKITSPLSWLVLIGITLIIVVTLTWSIKGTLPTTMDVKGIIVEPESTSTVHSFETGEIRKVYVKKGEWVEIGEDLFEIKKSTGDRVTIESTATGTVSELFASYYDSISTGDELLKLNPNVDEDLIVVLYVPFSEIQKIDIGMKAYIYPTSVDRQKYGHMEATVFRKDKAPVSVGNMKYVLGANNMMSDEFTKNGAIVAVLCKLTHDDSTASGYYWSTDNSKDLLVNSTTMVEAKFIVDESAPITKLIPEFVNN